MKANFLKRVLAFCFDYFILTLVLSFITVVVYLLGDENYEGKFF